MEGKKRLEKSRMTIQTASCTAAEHNTVVQGHCFIKNKTLLTKFPKERKKHGHLRTLFIFPCLVYASSVQHAHCVFCGKIALNQVNMKAQKRQKKFKKWPCPVIGQQTAVCRTNSSQYSHSDYVRQSAGDSSSYLAELKFRCPLQVM